MKKIILIMLGLWLWSHTAYADYMQTKVTFKNQTGGQIHISAVYEFAVEEKLGCTNTGKGKAYENYLDNNKQDSGQFTIQITNSNAPCCYHLYVAINGQDVALPMSKGILDPCKNAPCICRKEIKFLIKKNKDGAFILEQYY